MYGGPRKRCSIVRSATGSLTRGRDTNLAYLHERRATIANHDERARTAHDIAADTQDRDQLPDRVRGLLDRRAYALQARRSVYARWQDATLDQALERQRWIDQHMHRDRSHEQSFDYGIDL